MFSSDGQWVATADGSPKVRLFDPESARREVLRIRHRDWPSSMALSPNGQRLATVEHTQLETRGSSEESFERFARIWEGGGRDEEEEGEATAKGKIRIWDVATGKVTGTIPHDGGVYQVAFSPDGARIVTGGADHVAKLWDTTTGMQLDQLDHADNVNGVAFDPNGLFIATRTITGDARLWDLQSRTGRTVAKDGFVNELAFSPDGRFLATAEGDVVAEKSGSTSALVFGFGSQDIDPDKGDRGAEKQKQTDNAQAKKILGVRLWDVATGKNTIYLPHEKPVQDILFSPDGTLIATDMYLKRNDAVQLWDAATGEKIASLQASERGEGIDVKAFSRDGKYLAAKTYKPPRYPLWVAA